MNSNLLNNGFAAQTTTGITCPTCGGGYTSGEIHYCTMQYMRCWRCGFEYPANTVHYCSTGVCPPVQASTSSSLEDEVRELNKNLREVVKLLEKIYENGRSVWTGPR